MDLACMLALAGLALQAVAPSPSAQEDHLLDWIDRDGDGRLGPYEGAEAMLYLALAADKDGDGGASRDEIAAFLERALEDDGDLSDMLEEEVAGFLGELDRDGDGAVTPAEVPDHLRAEILELDMDGDERVTGGELRARLEVELGGATFEVRGSRAVMTGTIGPTTPGRVLELILTHPEVDTLVLADVPGSMDDEANLRAARLVRRRGYATVVPANGMVASGGVDFFLAGATRRAGPHARFGVHSWSGGPNEEGRDLPHDHPGHAMFVEYYDEMGVDPEFYWFTLEAAPADGVHWMSPQEVEGFALVTEAWDFEDEVLPPEDPYGLEAIDVSGAARGIVPLPAGVEPLLRRHFDRYSRVVAPNGRPIHILAQPPWTSDQITHARKVMEHLLADAPGTEYGADKSEVANAMADRRATLVLFATQEALERALRGPLGELELGMQDLRANECPAVGSADYLAHDTRDAAYEEILHLVHQYGIRPALPEYDARLQAANDAAVAAGLWKPWPEEDPESHRYEYIAAAYDNYLDLWTVPPTRYEGHPLGPGDIPEGTSHFGTFAAGSRAGLAELDPQGLRLIEAFFPPTLTYTAELPEDFEGTFSIAHDPGIRYTAKSQHLRSVTLRGRRDSGLIGNDFANALRGNAGDNVLEGRGGDDLLDGGAGTDTAVLRGAREEYALEETEAGLVVRDSRPERDGTDTLLGIEVLRFRDAELRR